MGEYAELAFERDYYRSFDEPNDNPVVIYSSDSKVIKYKNFNEGEYILARKYDRYYGDTLVFNRVCKIIKNTDKAVLFEIDSDWEPDCKNAGKRFWIPKSVIYMLKDELKVIYFKQWVKLKAIN